MKSGVYTVANDADRSRAFAMDSACYPTVESVPKKIPYPRAIPTLLGSMFFERAAMNGMKTVLILYLSTQLAYDTDTATMIYHSYMTLAFCTAIFGAILSDSWLGKYNTIMLMFVLGLVGMVLLNLGAVHSLQLPERGLTIAALVILALGTGCMKPCTVAFGGDQFRVPEQLHLMSAYFSLVFFTLKVSAFVGTALTPMLRTDVRCLGKESCYLLAFAVSGLILVVSMICFVMGKCMYVVRPSSGNIVVKVVQCICRGLFVRFKESSAKHPTGAPPAPAHWLDYAEPRHGKQLVHDTRILLNVLVLYVPIPFYWALNEQTGSRWTLQASRMIGDVFGYYTIKPDQMQIAMQVLLIAFIPLFQTVLYPALARLGFRRPLQKIALAMALAGAAFVVAGYVESHVATDYAVMPTPDACQLRVYNTWPHAVHVRREWPVSMSESQPSTLTEDIVINRLDGMQSIVPLVAFTSSESFAVRHPATNSSFALSLTAGQAVSYYFDGRNMSSFVDSPRKANSQRPRLRIVVVMSTDWGAHSMPLTLYDMNEQYVRYKRRSDNIQQFELAATRYTLRIGEHLVTDQLRLERGSVSTLLVVQRLDDALIDGLRFDVNLVELTTANSVHMLWMLPQYTLLAAGEAIMGVTGMYFAYSEAPESMKTVLQACWLLTIALGHFIDVIVVSANIIDSQTMEFFMFAGFMGANILLFTWLVSRYRPLSVQLIDVTSSPDGKPQILGVVNLPNKSYVINARV